MILFLIQFNYCIKNVCQKINFKRHESHIDSPDWIKDKKATRSLKNNDDELFPCGTTIALYFEEI